MSEEKVRLLGLLLGAGTLFLLAWLTLSVLFRVITGKGIAGRPPKEPVFVDRGAWGRSMKSDFTQAKGVSFPLVVALTPEDLVIRARYPATLFFMPTLFDLEHRVPRGEVCARLARDTWSRPGVHVTWTDRRGRDHRLELKLRGGDWLVDLLNAAPAEAQVTEAA